MKEPNEGQLIFLVPASNQAGEHVSFSTDMGGPDKSVAHAGEYTMIMKKGTVRIEGGTGQHVGTVNLGWWRLLRLATHYEQQDLIRVLSGWISQVQVEQR